MVRGLLRSDRLGIRGVAICDNRYGEGWMERKMVLESDDVGLCQHVTWLAGFAVAG